MQKIIGLLIFIYIQWLSHDVTNAEIIDIMGCLVEEEILNMKDTDHVISGVLIYRNSRIRYFHVELQQIIISHINRGDGHICSWDHDIPCNGISEVHNLVGKAVADAKYSALRQWMAECVLSGDFTRLNEMLTWFVREDKVLRSVFPDLRYRKAMFMRLAGNRQAARRMLWADLAFNWRDKRGDSLANTIAKQFRHETSFVEAEEKALLKEAAEILDAIHSERMDTYTVMERTDDCTLTLRHRDGRVFREVNFPMSVPQNVQGRHLAAQLVTYNNKTYISGSAVWFNEEALPTWKGEANWNDIVKKEQDAAKLTYFTTAFGKRICLYDDLYTVPEDPEEACYADMGIYFDEPNIFDFLGGRPNGKVIYLGG